MRKPWLFALVATLGLLLGIGAAPAKAGVDDFSFDSFHADYVLGRDGEGRSTLRTTEHFVARFPDFDQNRGFIRAIPRVFDGHWVEPSDLTVTDENGAARPFWTEVSGDFLRVVMAVPEGSYVRGVQLYVLSFTQRDVTAFYPDTDDDEFYWDLNGTDTKQPFGEVSAALSLGEGLEEALTGGMACYRGALGSDAQCEIIRDGGVFSVREQGLGPGENVSIAVGFASGTFAPAPESSMIPVYSGRGNEFLNDPFGLRRFGGGPGFLIASGASFATMAGLLISAIRRARRQSRTGRAIIAQYEPPPGLSVAVAAEVMKADSKAMTASLLDFAVRRKIRLLHHLPSDAYGAQAIDDTGLLPEETELYESIFVSGTPGESIWFDTKSTRLGDAAGLLASRSLRVAERAGYYSNVPLRTVAPIATLGLAGLALFVLHALLNWGFIAIVFSAVIAFIAFIWLVISSGFLFLGRKPLTLAGGILRDHLLGLREYIRLAEADRIRMLQSASGAEVDERFVVQVYERLLPYAVIFGYEKEWQSELARYYRESTPDWVVGDGSFATAFRLSSLHTAVAASPVTATSSGSSGGFGSGGSFSSSSGGSSGGGFSGGGGGGGGTSGI